MATIKQHIDARNDNDLLDRFVAAAERNNVPNPQAWAEQRRGKLVSQQVADDGSTLADVHAYAVSSYAGRPGEDATKVTDAYIESAVAKVRAAESA